MARKKGFGVSTITNIIYYGTQDTEKNMWVGKKENVTDETIKAVFEWFMNNHKENEPNEAFEIKYEGIPYVLRMTKIQVDDYSNYYNKGNDCDACRNQYRTGIDGDSYGCRCQDNAEECCFVEAEQKLAEMKGV